MLAPEAASGFLAAIAEQPADAALRLIYADFLDDHGRHAEALAWRETADRVPADYEEIRSCHLTGKRTVYVWLKEHDGPDASQCGGELIGRGVAEKATVSLSLFDELPADIDGDTSESYGTDLDCLWYATVLDAIRGLITAAMRLKEKGR